LPTAISAEMGGAGAADQPEVDGLVHLSTPQPLKGAQVVPPEDCGRHSQPRVVARPRSRNHTTAPREKRARE
jgi:hypothetical protein